MLTSKNKVEIFHVLGPRHLRYDKQCTDKGALLNINTRRHSVSMIEQEIDCKIVTLDNKTLIKR